MFELSNLKPAAGSSRKKKKVGRGDSSGHGKTCGRGTKGQKSRTGGTKGPWFEGGQTPLYRRLPKKRGFTNLFKKIYTTFNVSQLNGFDGAVTKKLLIEKDLIGSESDLVKILGDGEITKVLTVEADGFSKEAKKKIEKAGGKAVLLPQAKKSTGKKTKKEKKINA